MEVKVKLEMTIFIVLHISCLVEFPEAAGVVKGKANRWGYPDRADFPFLALARFSFLSFDISSDSSYTELRCNATSCCNRSWGGDTARCR